MNARLGIPMVLLGLAVGSACSTAVAAENVFGTAAAGRGRRTTAYFGPASSYGRGYQTGCANCGECAATGVCVCGPECQCSAPYCNGGGMRPTGFRGAGYPAPGNAFRRGWGRNGYGASSACDGMACGCSCNTAGPRGRPMVPGTFNSWPQFAPIRQTPVYQFERDRPLSDSPFFQ